jgi:hypothetical protein
MQQIARIHALLRTLGPYLVLEILMPGGTLLALLLFLYRRGRLLQAARIMGDRNGCVRRSPGAGIAGDVELATPCSTSV